MSLHLVSTASIVVYSTLCWSHAATDKLSNGMLYYVGLAKLDLSSFEDTVQREILISAGEQIGALYGSFNDSAS